MVDVYRQQLQARAAQAATNHPGGVIALPRAVVSRIAYEPLGSTSGLPIGARLRYSIHFPKRQTIAAVPHVFPVYQTAGSRGLITMKPVGGSISPAPTTAGAQSLRDVIVYRAAATYDANVTYTFSVDLIPDFVFQGTQTGRFCVQQQKFMNSSVEAALVASQSPISYSITISDTGTVANIPAFLALRTFYESFSAGGAIDCGQETNTRF